MSWDGGDPCISVQSGHPRSCFLGFYFQGNIVYSCGCGCGIIGDSCYIVFLPCDTLLYYDTIGEISSLYTICYNAPYNPMTLPMTHRFLHFKQASNMTQLPCQTSNDENFILARKIPLVTSRIVQKPNCFRSINAVKINVSRQSS